MILKVQLPLGGDPMILVYDKSRSFLRIFAPAEFSADVVNEMKAAGKVKAFYQAEVEHTVLTFGEMVPDERW